jgi:hypothetical protein
MIYFLKLSCGLGLAAGLIVGALQTTYAAAPSDSASDATSAGQRLDGARPSSERIYPLPATNERAVLQQYAQLTQHGNCYTFCMPTRGGGTQCRTVCRPTPGRQQSKPSVPPRAQPVITHTPSSPSPPRPTALAPSPMRPLGPPPPAATRAVVGSPHTLQPRATLVPDHSNGIRGAAPGHLSLKSASGTSSAGGQVAKSSASTPVAILTGGKGQQQCVTCQPGQNYVLTQTNTSCPQGNCTFKFLGTPGCGSNGPSCWQLVPGTSPQVAGTGQTMTSQAWTGMPQYHAPAVTYGPSSSNPASFSDDLQAWLRSTGDDPWSGLTKKPIGTVPAQQPVDQARAGTDFATRVGDQVDAVNGLEQDIWEATLGAISQYQDQFIDDIKLAGKDFAELELESIANGDTSSRTVKENLGYALVAGGTNAAIDAFAPKSGEPLKDTMNVLAHTLNNMPSLDWSLSGALQRVYDVRQTMTGYFKSNLDNFSEQFKNFSATGP